MSNTKQVIVVARRFPDGRGGLMSPRTGKMIAQACHASMAFVTNRIVAALSRDSSEDSPNLWNPLGLSEVDMEWMQNGHRKIVVQVEDSETLQELHRICEASGLESHLITDCGYTEFKGEMITALAIGPDYSHRIDPITSQLRLM